MDISASYACDTYSNELTMSLWTFDSENYFSFLLQAKIILKLYAEDRKVRGEKIRPQQTHVIFWYLHNFHISDTYSTSFNKPLFPNC